MNKNPSIISLVFIIVLSLYGAAVLQPFVQTIQLFGASIDLILIVAILLAIRTSPTIGAFCGFFAGLLWGALLDKSVTTYCAVFTISCALAGYAQFYLAKDYILTSALTVFTLTILSSVFLLLINPPNSHIGLFILDILLKAVYNGVIAAPLYFIYRRIKFILTRS